MIPIEIIQLLDRQKGETHRTQPLEHIREKFGLLGLSEESPLAQFFSQHKVGGILSPRRGDTLLDMDSIVDATSFGREVYEIQEHYICLTSGEGEGFYLLDKRTGEVFDADVAQLDDLEAGKMKPRWSDFFDLIYWYLGGDHPS